MADDLKPDPVTLTYYVPIGNEEDEDRVKITITTFGSGDTVEWLTWLKSFERLIRLKVWGEDGPTLFLNARIMLRDMALDIFNAAARGVQCATPENFNTVMMQVAREFLVQDAREYLIDMIRNRRKTRDVSVTNHLALMRQLATLVTTLPENDAPPSEKSLMYHFRKSMPPEWQTKYEESGREAATLSELARYFTRLEMNSERKEARAQPARKEGARTTNPPKQQRGKPKVSAKPLKPATGKWCSHRRTNTHSDEECHYQQKKRAEELNYCEVPDDYDELNGVTAESSSVETTTECKSETTVRLRGTGVSRLFTALVDTGASKTLIDPAVLDRQQRENIVEASSSFRLPSGSLTSHGTLQVQLQLTEFGENRKIKWNCSVAEQLPYGLIIGRDLIGHFGLVLDFKSKEFIWDGVRVPMRSRDGQSVGEQIETLLASAPHHEESSIAQAERRQMEILDADYKKEPLEEHVPDYLSESEQVDLLKLLTKFEPTVFSGKVGSWKGEPYEIPTKPNLVPYHGKPYPIPHSLLETTKKEIARLEKLKIIAKCERSPWAAPSFIIPKANKTVRTLCDLRRLNAQLDRHPWPLPKINELFRSIPRFVFVTVMDLNMGYYAIHLTYKSSLLTAFILPFGKYIWLLLPITSLLHQTISRHASTNYSAISPLYAATWMMSWS